MQDDLDHSSFAEWLIELNDCALKAGYKVQQFTQITGQLCWHSDYESGVLPEDALKAAEKDGLEFGNSYFVD